MDTNTQKELTEQKKQELEEKVERFNQKKTTLPNQARETMGSSAFEQADKLAQKPLSNDEPLSFEKSFDTNSQAKADKLTNIGLESQTPQNQSSYAIIPPDVSEGVKYQKYRNTGVDYFDRKGNLSLLDAYLAKQLGLNVSYNFHKIDMKVDNTSRIRQSVSGRNRYNKASANFMKLGSNALSFGNAEWKNDRHYLERVGATGIDKVFGSLTNTNVPQDVLLAMIKNNTADNLSLGTPQGASNKNKEMAEDIYKTYADTETNVPQDVLLAMIKNNTADNLSLGTPQGASNKNKEMAEDIYKTYADTERVFSAVGELFTNNIAEMEAGLMDMKVSGTHNPREIQMLENQLATAKKVQQLFRESNKENMKNNSIAIMAELAKAQKFAF